LHHRHRHCLMMEILWNIHTLQTSSEEVKLLTMMMVCVLLHHQMRAALQRRSIREDVTTDTDDIAMAAPASMGGSRSIRLG